jgi:lipoprotein-releasing system permease protein
MFTPFERLVAGRYLRARKGERFVSIIAIFSLVGIALGVATLIVVTSVMTGFQRELVGRVLGVNGHITLDAYQGEKITDYEPLAAAIAALPGVTAALPMLDGQVFLTTEGRQGGSGGLVRGITSESLRKIAPIADHIVAGSLDDFKGEDALAVGVSLAANNRLTIGSRLTLISPQGPATAFGNMPRIKAYRVVAIYDSGLATFNNNVVFLSLPAAQIFFMKDNAVTGFEIRLADPETASATLAAIRPLIAGRDLVARDWRNANNGIIAVLQIQKDTMFIVLGMIILVAAFNVISSLIMLVKDKRRDIAVMRTMGAESGAIMRIFIMCGAFVGVAGTALGTFMGVLVCRNIVAIQHVIEDITGGQVFDRGVFMLTDLPSGVEWGGVANVVILALSLSLLATLYPSWQAARTDPVEVLRSE